MPAWYTRGMLFDGIARCSADEVILSLAWSSTCSGQNFNSQYMNARILDFGRLGLGAVGYPCLFPPTTPHGLVHQQTTGYMIGFQTHAISDL